MMFTFTACMPVMNRQFAQNESRASTSQQEESSAVEKEEEPETSGMTLADLVDLYGESWEEMGSSSLVDCEISSQGDTLTCAYTYLDQVDNSGNLAADTIEENLNDTAESITQQADAMAELVGQDIVIEMVYYNADGTLLTKKSYDGTCS